MRATTYATLVRRGSFLLILLMTPAMGHAGAPKQVTEAQIQQWVKDLGGNQANARKAEIHLQELGAKALPFLAKGLQSSSWMTRSNAAHLLSKLQHEATPATIGLLRALRDQNALVRGFAARALGHTTSHKKKVLASLVHAFTDKDAGVRREAGRAIQRKGAVAIPLVAKGLKHPSYAVRRTSLQLMLKLQPDSSLLLKPLMLALNGKDRGLQMAAVEALGKMGVKASSALPALLAVAKNTFGERKQRVLRALGQIGTHPKLVIPLLKAEFKSLNLEVCRAAVESMGKFPASASQIVSILITAYNKKRKCMRWSVPIAIKALGAKANQPLIALLRSPVLRIRRNAAWLLFLSKQKPQHSKPALLAALQETDIFTRHFVAVKLFDMNVRTKPVIVALMGSFAHSTYNIYASAAQRVAKEGKKVIPDLRARLAHKHVNIRRASIYALGWMKGVAKPAIPELLKALQDKDKNIRHQAIETLGKIKAKAAVLPLLSLLNGKNDTAIMKACRALGRIGPAAKPASQRLAQLLTKKHWAIPRYAADALAQIGAGADAALPALLQVMQTKNESLRESVVQALARVGRKAKEATIALSKALKDTSPDIRLAASMSLYARNERVPLAIQTLIGDLKGNTGYKASKALAKMGKAALPALRRALSGNEAKCGWAAAALGNIGKPARIAIPELLQSLKRRFEGIFTRRNIIQTLGQIGDRRPAVIAAVKRFIRSKNSFVRYAATKSLKDLRSAK